MFNHAPFYRQAILLILLLTAILFVNSCSLLGGDDKPSIEWKEEDLSDYVLYAYPSEKVAIIDVQSGDILKVLDDFDERVRSLITNESGTIIYVSTADGHASTNPGKIYRIDTESWSREIVYEHAAYLLESKNGDIFFLDRSEVKHKRVLGKINDDTGEVFIIDSLNVYWSLNDRETVQFDSKRSKMYATDSDHRLYRYDYLTSEIEFIFDDVNFLQFPRMNLSEDGDLMFIAGGPVLDLVDEQIVGSIPAWRFGMAAARKDLREVYITDPGGGLRNPPPSGKISIYSPEKNKIIDRIQTDVYDSYSGEYLASSTDRIFLTDKERYAIVNGWVYTFFVIDLRDRKVVNTMMFFEDNVPTLPLHRVFLSKKPPGL